VSRHARAAAVALVLLEAGLAFSSAACRKIDRSSLPAVRSLPGRLAPRFQAPANGEITPAQVDLYLRVRRAGRHGSDIEAARALGLDPVEFVWVRSRVLEAVAYLEARRVREGASEAWTRSIAVLREARRETSDARAAARLDAEIGALQREAAATRQADAGLAAGARNAPKIAARRAEIDAVAP
jgi:hypothetical protein